MPVGNYTAETFLIDGGRVIAGAPRDIRIEKSGFERFVATPRGACARSTAWSPWPVAAPRLGRRGLLPPSRF